MSSNWQEAFFDASRLNGSKIYVQAGMRWSVNIAWVKEALEYAQQRMGMRTGELKSDLYFTVLEHARANQLSYLVDRMHEGPRWADIVIYDQNPLRHDMFSKLGIQEEDLRRDLNSHNEFYRQLGHDIFASSAISNFDQKIIKLIPSYGYSEELPTFDPGILSQSFRNDARHIVIVAARAQALFGDLSDLSINADSLLPVIYEKVDELLRSIFLFDVELSPSIEVLLRGIYAVHLRRSPSGIIVPLEDYPSVVLEKQSETRDGIQAADIAAAIARNKIREHSTNPPTVNDEVLSNLLNHFSVGSVTLNGLRHL